MPKIRQGSSNDAQNEQLVPVTGQVSWLLAPSTDASRDYEA